MASGPNRTTSEPNSSWIFLTIFTALDDVQQISDSALTAAVEFTYVTTGIPGYFPLNSA